ncbi:unnamed protein product [Didymodactylos carnosus]|uniref:Uncharacterized protein n=1 Tax=Didymodactylos carnosus TaxID=1234261 RepID=A0A815YR03_9BILA|nr:unnamed protein product [Didymodactylos carnosus]CAF1573793.1 unnamed protein product [Didymodactylos carnosus]CAF4240740.1 unnamed protein product [Didymodactylos carnosus]CAF4437979.1 unnamed protein product [Didymodactylos carnosus]
MQPVTYSLLLTCLAVILPSCYGISFPNIFNPIQSHVNPVAIEAKVCSAVQNGTSETQLKVLNLYSRVLELVANLQKYSILSQTIGGLQTVIYIQNVENRALLITNCHQFFVGLQQAGDADVQTIAALLPQSQMLINSVKQQVMDMITSEMGPLPT